MDSRKSFFSLIYDINYLGLKWFVPGYCHGKMGNNRSCFPTPLYSAFAGKVEHNCQFLARGRDCN